MRDINCNAWAAGIIDGEGWLGLSKDTRCNYTSTIIKVRMGDEDIIRRLHSKFGGTYKFVPSKNPKHKDMHEWALCEQTAVHEALVSIRPYLSIRRKEKCDLMLRHLQSNSIKVKQLFE